MPETGIGRSVRDVIVDGDRAAFRRPPLDTTRDNSSTGMPLAGSIACGEPLAYAGPR